MDIFPLSYLAPLAHDTEIDQGRPSWRMFQFTALPINWPINLAESGSIKLQTGQIICKKRNNELVVVSVIRFLFNKIKIPFRTSLDKVLFKVHLKVKGYNYLSSAAAVL